MERLEMLATDVADILKKTEECRNQSLSESRKIIRASKQVIHAVHIGEESDSGMESMRALVSELQDKVKDEPTVLYGPALEDAMMEFSEAAIFKAVSENKDIPSYLNLNITPQSWILGLCDSLGELRRLLLSRLMVSDFDGAKDIFLKMETISDTVMAFDIPDAIAPVRRKQDIARGIMERSRSDLTLAVIMHR